MKKLIISMLMIASCFGVANAQLMVDQNGKVGFGIETGTLTSLLSVNSTGNSTSTAYMQSTDPEAVYISHYSPVSTHNSYAIRSMNLALPGVTNFGISSHVAGGSSSTNTKGVAVYGNVAAGATGYCYGVYGRLNTTNYGAAIFGSTSAASSTEFPSLPGTYAGFFYGDVRATGKLTAGTIVQSSDYRLKENIRSLTEADGCLNKVMEMNVIEYNMKQRQFTTNITEQDIADEVVRKKEITACEVSPLEITDNNESRNTPALWYEEDSPIIKNKHYGLIAQELREIYPDLVDEGEDGYLAINYMEIIPLLIRSVQELKAELDATKGSNAPVQKAQARNTDVTNIDAIVTTLYQNTPNPFTESTLIRCDVADDVVKADLYIYNMNGEQITEYAVTERGETSITIDGGSLNAGMYLYALIADGQVIDTKRMILTK